MKKKAVREGLGTRLDTYYVRCSSLVPRRTVIRKVYEAKAVVAASTITVLSFKGHPSLSVQSFVYMLVMLIKGKRMT